MASKHDEILIQVLETGGFKRIENPKFMEQNLLWSYDPELSLDTLEELNKFQKINHFPGSENLNQKDKLWNNISNLMIQHSNHY